MIWSFLRRNLSPPWKVAYRRVRGRLIDPFDRGVLVPIGGQRVRVPAYFQGAGRADYETTAVSHFVDWLDRHPDAELIDCGCSLSIYGVIALSRSPGSRVIGIDPDLVSLKCTRRLCEKTVAARARLRLVHGFLGADHTSGCKLAAVATETAARLNDPTVPDFIEASDYREVTDARFASVPRHSLDGLFADEVLGRPRLLKIDVEGFELEVLRGATALLDRLRPVILLSAHPQFYERLATTSAALHTFVRNAGYSSTLIATDHEEHWWCRPQ